MCCLPRNHRLRCLLSAIAFVGLWGIANPCRAHFTTIINSPPTVIGDDASIGSNTQLNVLDGGSIGYGFSAGSSDGESTNVEVNIFGGSVGDHFGSFAGSRVTITGGSVGRALAARSGSQVTISGGTVGRGLSASGGSQVHLAGGSVADFFTAGTDGLVTISGGSVGDEFTAELGSQVTILGGEFRLDGTLVEGLDTAGDTLPLHVPEGVLFTGVLADGTPFAFSTLDGDLIHYRTLTVELSSLPSIGPPVITASLDTVPLGIREGQTLVVDDGGVVGDHFNAGRGSSVEVHDGGIVGDNLEVVGADVIISGGVVGHHFDAFDGSHVEVSGGSVGSRFEAHPGSQVTISGGTIGDYFEAHDGSRVTVTGGSVGSRFSTRNGSHVEISGGSVASDVWVDAGSRIEISGGTIGPGLQVSGNVVYKTEITVSGGEFRIDGVLIEGLEDPGDTVPLDRRGALFSGVLADGTPFAFSSHDGDYLPSGAVTLQSSLLPPIGPPLITASTDPVPLGIRAGQTLVVDDGGVVPDNFNAGIDSSVFVQHGGVVGDHLEAVHAEMIISGGSVGNSLRAFPGSRVEISGGSVGDDVNAFDSAEIVISGGSVGDFFRAFDGSEVRISGGSVGRELTARTGSQVTISGGTVGRGMNAVGGSQVQLSGGSIGDFFTASSDSQVTIAGGSVGDVFTTEPGSRVTLSGGEFRLDGSLVEGLETSGDSLPLHIPHRALFTGVLADGTPFAFTTLDGDIIGRGTLTLELSSLPAIGPPVITASRDAVPLGIREGQTLVVDDGGVVGDHFNAGRGSSVEVHEGGIVGDNLEAVGAEVIISGGSVGGEMDAFDASLVTISGGSVGAGVRAREGSQVVVSGGAVNGFFLARSGSQVNISGGSIEGRLEARDSSQVNLFGTEFSLGGRDLTDTALGIPVTIDERDTDLVATLADGSPFHFDLTHGFVSPEATITATLVSQLSGDFNSDGLVSQNDLNLVLLNWGNALPNPYAVGWINDLPTGLVSQNELDEVLMNWGSSVGRLSSASVPEPSAAIALLIAAVIGEGGACWKKCLRNCMRFGETAPTGRFT